MAAPSRFGSLTKNMSKTTQKQLRIGVNLNAQRQSLKVFDMLELNM
jgi:hypothetical protein